MTRRRPHSLLWLRATERLGAIMHESVDVTGDAQDAVVAAAVVAVTSTRRHRASAQLFFAQRSDQLFSADLAPEIVEDLEAQYRRLRTLMIDLAAGVWDRKDRIALNAVATCVVDVPGDILRRTLIEDREIDPVLERWVEAAVGAILAVPLAPPHPQTVRGPT